MSQVKSSRRYATSSRIVTQEKIEKRIVAGDGQGVRERYVPWIKVRAFASRGTSHIVPGVTVHRAHHLLSNAEYHDLVLLEHDRSIIDIREQFPLLPTAETHALASGLNTRPPSLPGYFSATGLRLSSDVKNDVWKFGKHQCARSCAVVRNKPHPKLLQALPIKASSQVRKKLRSTAQLLAHFSTNSVGIFAVSAKKTYQAPGF